MQNGKEIISLVDDINEEIISVRDEAENGNDYKVFNIKRSHTHKGDS